MWSMIVSWPTITLAISSRMRVRASHRRATIAASSLESAAEAFGLASRVREVSIVGGPQEKVSGDRENVHSHSFTLRLKNVRKGLPLFR